MSGEEELMNILMTTSFLLTFVDHLTQVWKVLLRQHCGERHTAAQPLLRVHSAEQGNRGTWHQKII